MKTSKLDPQLKKRLRANPEAPVRLIVGVAGDLDARAEDLAQRGLAVYRRLRILNALAALGTGAQALALDEEPWVTRLEEDREVRAHTAVHGGGR